MRVAICDINTFPGIWQKFLALTWRIGCFLHKLFGQLDAYHVAKSWDDAFTWLEVQPKPLTSIQLWGHGAPGTMWVAGQQLDQTQFKRIIRSVIPESVVWFRTCSTFRGQEGYDLSKYLTDLLQCTVAAHTRTIGVFQSGLHTRKPNQIPSWPLTETDEGNKHLVYLGLQWGNNTILCLRTKIPKGW